MALKWAHCKLKLLVKIGYTIYEFFRSTIICQTLLKYYFAATTIPLLLFIVIF
jgi:hypothetical protein